jgi:transcriptional regulator with XRE-family HTH domain
VEDAWRSPQAFLGNRVRRLRLRKRLSQEDLADVCGLHRTYLGSVERGERNVSLTNIVRLARALDTTPSRLLTGLK